jgi:hypothetical protein
MLTIHSFVHPSIFLLLLLEHRASVKRFVSLQFLNLKQSVEFLGRGISTSQGRYLHTEQHKHRINAHNTDTHVSSGSRTYDPSFRAGEDSSCLRPSGYCDRLASERAKTVHALECSATVIDSDWQWC